MKPEDFEGREPRFILEDFFEGQDQSLGHVPR